MQLVITLRKEVDDRDQGEMILELVKTRLADRTDIKVTGHVTSYFPESEEPK